MKQRIAVIGAGVSGLTCATLLAEHNYETTILAEDIGLQTTSAAAGAIWYPYDVEPFDATLKWALQSYKTFEHLSLEPGAGVSMIELRTFCRAETVSIPDWATKLGASIMDTVALATPVVRANDLPCRDHPTADSGPIFSSGFAMRVPMIDTTIYLDYLTDRFRAAGGTIIGNRRLDRLDEAAVDFSTIVNCAGIGARLLVPDTGLEPHRGQVVIVPKLDLSCAIVCDDAPLMYAIPRTNDCLFGGSNEVSEDRQPDPATTAAILGECSRVLNIEPPPVLAERVGLRPFRRSGVRLEVDRLGDRTVIHNYGHGGAGFTLSWGCAEELLRLAQANA